MSRPAESSIPGRRKAFCHHEPFHSWSIRRAVGVTGTNSCLTKPSGEVILLDLGMGVMHGVKL